MTLDQESSKQNLSILLDAHKCGLKEYYSAFNLKNSGSIPYNNLFRMRVSIQTNDRYTYDVHKYYSSQLIHKLLHKM